LLLGALAFLPTLRGKLVWDDEVTADYQLAHFDSARDVLAPPSGITRWSYGYYRPVVVASYLADARLFAPGAAAGPRAMNLLMHLAVTALVFLLVRRIVRADVAASGSGADCGSGASRDALGCGSGASRDASVATCIAPTREARRFRGSGARRDALGCGSGASRDASVATCVAPTREARRFRGSGASRDSAIAASCGAALFALHPIHAESVNWIAGRSDLLATLFLLGALLTALAWRERGAAGALAATPALFLLALLSKESAIAGLALLPAALLLGTNPPLRAVRIRLALAAAGILLATGGYFWLRSYAGVLDASPGTLTPAERAVHLVRATAYYLRMLIVPWPQTAMVPWSLAPGLGLAIAIAGSAAVLALAAWVRWWRTAEVTWLLAAIWAAATLALPAWIAITGLNNTPLAERYLYLPSVALSLAAARAVQCGLGSRWRVATLVTTVLVLLSAGAATMNRALVWQSGLALWADAARIPGAPGLAWLNLGVNRMESGDDAGALAALARVREDPQIEPGWLARAENARGTIALRQADTAAAERHFRAATAAMPDNHEPQYGLAAVYQERAVAAAGAGDIAARDAAAEQAIAYYVAALSRNALYHPVRLRFADFLRQAGDWQRDRGAMEAARRRYGAALAQLDELAARIPRTQQDDVYARIAPEAGVDPMALRTLLIARLDAAGAEPTR
jgi:tetratricopeptide (TPR) repeat protein